MGRKLFTLMLAAAVALTACGPKADVIDGGSKPEAAEELTEKLEEEPKPPFKATPKQAGVSQAETAEEPEAAFEFVKGTVSESGWESQWLNMRFNAPEGTRMASKEQLTELMGISGELLAEDLDEAQLPDTELTTVREMMCYDERTKTNVIVSVDSLPARLPEEDYAKQLETALAAVSVMTYQRAGEDECVEIAGIPWLRSDYQVEAMGRSVHTDYYIRMIGDKVVSLIVTYGEDGEKLADSMIGSFEAVHF